MACLTAATSSGEVFDVAASASVVFGRAGAVGETAGRSGIVDGVNAGGLLGTSGPPPPMTPEEGIDDVEVTGRVGTASDFGPGAPFTEACAVGFSALSGLCVDLPDFSEDLVEFSDLFAALPGLSDFPDFSVGFADLSDFSDLFAGLALCAGFAELSGVAAAWDCGAGIASAAGAAQASPVKKPTAANASMSRMAVTGTDLSAAAFSADVSEIDVRHARLKNYSVARRLGNRRISRRKRGIGPSASFDSR